MTHLHTFLLIITLLISGHSQANTDHSNPTNTSRNCANIRKIHNALAQNKAIAIIIDDNRQKNKTGADDSYADWLYYWKTFISDSQQTFMHFQLKSATLNTILQTVPNLNRTGNVAISFLFFNHNRAFIYNGPIYEPQVYMYVQYSLMGKKIPDNIKPFKADDITIQLRNCTDH